jgi:uncharacterized protein YggE
MGRTRLAAVVVATALLAAPSAGGVTGQPIERGITVTGTAFVTTVPDRAGFRFGVRTQGTTASGTLAAASAAARKVVAAIEAAGVAAADIQTDQVSLAPRFVKGRVAGYVAADAVSVTIRDLGRLAAVIDGAVRAGATEVDGPSFSRSNTGELYRSALASAVADARAKAQALATAAGASVGSVLEVREGSDTGGDVVARAAPAAGPSVEPGTLEIDATVTVTFAAA